jgi:hypothetical protein
MNTYIITFKFLLEDSDSIPTFVMFMLTSIRKPEKQKKTMHSVPINGATSRSKGIFKNILC